MFHNDKNTEAALTLMDRPAQAAQSFSEQKRSQAAKRGGNGVSEIRFGKYSILLLMTDS